MILLFCKETICVSKNWSMSGTHCDFYETKEERLHIIQLMLIKGEYNWSWLYQFFDVWVPDDCSGWSGNKRASLARVNALEAPFLFLAFQKKISVKPLTFVTWYQHFREKISVNYLHGNFFNEKSFVKLEFLHSNHHSVGWDQIVDIPLPHSTLVCIWYVFFDVSASVQTSAVLWIKNLIYLLKIFSGFDCGPVINKILVSPT